MNFLKLSYMLTNQLQSAFLQQLMWKAAKSAKSHLLLCQNISDKVDDISVTQPRDIYCIHTSDLELPFICAVHH